MKKFIVTIVACFAVSVVSSSKILFSAERQDNAAIPFELNNHINPHNIRKDIGSAD